MVVEEPFEEAKPAFEDTRAIAVRTSGDDDDDEEEEDDWDWE